MSVPRSRFVAVCQQAIAVGVVLAVAVSAASVVSLDIVSPGPAARHQQTAVAASAAAPIRPVVREVPLDGIDREGLRALSEQTRSPASTVTNAGLTTSGLTTSATRLSVLSAPEPVDGYATVGITWRSSPQVWGRDRIEIELRTKTAGTWSTWQPVQNDPEHEADPEEIAQVRDGTDPVVVGAVQDVQVRATTVDGRTPDDMSLALVDPGGPGPAHDGALESPDPVSSGSGAPRTAMTVAATTTNPVPAGSARLAAATTVPRPAIRSRADWRADERMRDPSSLRYGTIKAGFVHHTVNANSYTRGQVPAIIRGIYAYHTQSRGWSDIGYNFLVDRFGRIWEGRYGGVARPVVGAHTLGYNDYSFAMSAIGNFETARPTAAMISAYARLFAWKLSLAGVSASSTRQRLGSHYFRAISGHRDAGSTACPGRYLYAQLPRIRTLAARYQRRGPVRVVPEPRTNLSGAAWPDLVVRDARTKKVRIVRTGGQMRFAPRRPAARGIPERRRVVVAGDLTGDRRPDLLVLDPRTGSTRMFRGTARATFVRTGVVTDRFAGLNRLTGVGDWNRDGKDDLVGRGRRGRLWLFPGRDDGSFAPARRLARNVSGYDLVIGVGDFDGDHRVDLAARAGARLYLLPGRASGIGRRVALPGRWARFDVVAGRGDATGDGEPDLLARSRAAGRTYVFPGTGTGGLGHWLGPFERFAGFRSLALAPVTGGAAADAVAWSKAGRVSVVANNDARNVQSVVATGLTLPAANLLLNVGDWDGDSRGDIMTRSARTGSMYLRRGLGRNRFAAPVRVARGWAAVSRLAPVGDVTGDGRPDLAGRYRGRTRVYPGKGRSGFGRSYVVGSAGWVSSPPSGAASMSWVVGIGDLNGDGRRQDLLLRTPAGNLWYLPAASTGFLSARFVAPGFGGYDLAG
jgi:hypothetical protein